jgi:hypothetical protein
MPTRQRFERVMISSLLVAVLLAACNPSANTPTPQPGGHVISQRTKTTGIDHDCEPCNHDDAQPYIDSSVHA